MRPSLHPSNFVHRQCGRRWVRYSTSVAKPNTETPFDFLRDLSLKPLAGRWDLHNVNSLYRALHNHLKLAPQNDTIRPGFHQVSFNEFLRESDLCADGADSRYSPGDDWKFRVWVGGSMKFYKQFSYHNHNNLIFPSEKVTDVRVVGNPASHDAKVLVTLTKTYNNAERVPGSTLLQPVQDVPSILSEDKHLCFMRNIPASLRSLDVQRKIPPPAEPFHAQTMKPTPALLFRFSALTANDHKIHLDPDFTRQEYGIPNLLVHGPLTAVLMLEVLRRGLQLYTRYWDHVLPVAEFDYKNLMPLFVDETITIACKHSEILRARDGLYESRSGVPFERWDVWIQKGEGQNATVAARGKAILVPVKKRPKAGGVTSSDAVDGSEESLEHQYRSLTQY